MCYPPPPPACQSTLARSGWWPGAIVLYGPAVAFGVGTTRCLQAIKPRACACACARLATPLLVSTLSPSSLLAQGVRKRAALAVTAWVISSSSRLPMITTWSCCKTIGPTWKMQRRRYSAHTSAKEQQGVLPREDPDGPRQRSPPGRLSTAPEHVQAAVSSVTLVHMLQCGGSRVPKVTRKKIVRRKTPE